VRIQHRFDMPSRRFAIRFAFQMILTASPSARTIAHWNAGLADRADSVAVADLEALYRTLRRAAPRILLLDLGLPRLDECGGVAGVRKASPATSIVVMSGPLADDVELALFRAGVRGCCRCDIAPDLLQRAIGTVERGELWIRRATASRLLDELVARPTPSVDSHRAASGRFADLTGREREIAALIGDGHSNKQIARQLAITERTVKAHLTEIFRKLGIADRLKLALRVTGHLQPERAHVRRSAVS
jgi:two-component system NarL family response regulator